MARPQNLLDVFAICIDNILKLYEDLQVALVEEHLTDTIKLGGSFPLKEEDRDELPHAIAI